ncbi:CRISPR-associated helicase/endonuclease Cas3 [Microbacterium sp. 77mftsu3.1]|uniref:CRISPR-associated helicase/endonuclease Cas3 n=1 Tax=Microbacterium sp. 77mftsu3.1 TaxID=1761802 RepID=UPI0003701652|nr:CRISPR-associated helicase/endonuclease Cas3 [Microbacterium sp. 77mftsu3.1]SDH49980.1 CRISPR-associated endonuclease/helicase Cas3 [Microbacterium sp. 77mftsu3.1]
MSTARTPFWGKTYRDDTGKAHAYDLRKHLLDTTGAAGAAWDQWLRPGLRDMLTEAFAPGDPTTARAIVMAVAGLHDIGKANPIFQSQSSSTRDLPIALRDIVRDLTADGLSMATPAGTAADEKTAARHEAVSHAVLTEFPAEATEKVGDRWSGAVVGGHHGRYHPGLAGDCSHTRDALAALTADPEWAARREEIITLVTGAVGLTADDLRFRLHAHEGAAVILLTGFTVVADWLASDALGLVATRPGEEAFPTVRAAAAYVRKAERAYRRTLPSTIGVYRAPANPRVAVMGTSTLPLYPLQDAATKTGRGLWIVAETTGSGKTESAMLRHMCEPGESVIWGLPTRATADKMWNRIQWMYRRTRNVGALMHAHRSLNGFYLAKNTDGPGLRYSPWATEVLGNVKPLLSPVAVGTVDQVLLGALRQKWTPVRLLAIANAHIILDEVHLMDEYGTKLAEELLAWWGLTDTRVTMLSASLPKALVQRYADAYAGDLVELEPAYPAHTLVSGGGEATVTEMETAREYDLDIDLRTFHYRQGERPDTTMASRTVELVLEARTENPTARIAVIMNRVGTVQNIADDLLHAGLPDVTTMHSRMSAAHRTALSADLEQVAGKGSRVEGCVVVGTQVIEASLDLDFDIIISELAPAAALIQRAGRQWRHSRVTAGEWGTHWHRRPTQKPKLTVISLLEPDEHSTGRPSEAMALPYSYGSLSRTFRALKAMQGTLAIPAGVQAFVDAAHYDPDDDAEEATTDELIAASIRRSAADEVTIRAADRQGPFHGPLTYGKLGRLTHPDELTESATRYTDYAQVPVLIVDQFSNGSWAWRGNLDDETVARHLASRAPRDVAVMLGLTVQVPLDKVGPGLPLIPLIEINKRFDRDESPFAASELRGVVPVRLAAGTHYDGRLGLRV